MTALVLLSLRRLGLPLASLAWAALVSPLSLLAPVGLARADGPSATSGPIEKRARDAYERGSAAYDRKDYGTAAREFAIADDLVPNRTALSAALDAAILADDPVIGMTLLDRARLSPADAALAKLMSAAETRFAHRTGKIEVACGAAPCLATLDGQALDPSAPRYATVGTHTVTLASEGRTEQRLLVVEDGALSVVGPTPKQPAAAPPPPAYVAPAPGISPAWFFVALGATAVAGGLTAVSGFDAKSKHDAFVDKGCGDEGVGGCSALSSDGEAATTRTNVALVVTGVLALATAGIGLFAVRWRSSAITVGAGTVSAVVSFR